jgi:hypothetical protein
VQLRFSARKQIEKALFFAGSTVDSIIQQPQHSLLKIDRLDPVESRLLPVVLLYTAS